MSKMPLPPEAPAEDAAYVVPRHGGGRLRPFRPGQSGNPSGQQGAHHQETVRMAREVAPEVMAALIGIALDPAEDTRARIVATQEILGRAFGRVPAEVKAAGGEPATLDASKLTGRELEVLWKLARNAMPDDTLQ